MVYDHRVLRLITMDHGRETTLSLNLSTVCILLLNVIVFISRDSVAYDIRILNMRLIAIRHGRERERKRKGKEIAYHMTSNVSRCRE